MLAPNPLAGFALTTDPGKTTGSKPLLQQLLEAAAGAAVAPGQKQQPGVTPTDDEVRLANAEQNRRAAVAMGSFDTLLGGQALPTPSMLTAWGQR